MATVQQIETKLRAPRSLNNIPFSVLAPSLDAALNDPKNTGLLWKKEASDFFKIFLKNFLNRIRNLKTNNTRTLIQDGHHLQCTV